MLRFGGGGLKMKARTAFAPQRETWTLLFCPSIKLSVKNLGPIQLSVAGLYVRCTCETIRILIGP
jgi:hypothetical protein